MVRNHLPPDGQLISRVCISISELEANNIYASDLEPFLLRPEKRRHLADQQIGLSEIDRQPLIKLSDSHITVALPTAISVAIRDYVISYILESSQHDAFDSALARSYAELFRDTPLLGDRSGAPVRWKRCGNHRWAAFSYQIDVGHYLSFYLYAPSVLTHPHGGFKGTFKGDDRLTAELRASVKKTIEHAESQPDFKKGFCILLSCGWGRGDSSTIVEMQNANWRFETMSAADLIRLSSLGDMSPQYFWRIQDGLDEVEEAGVEIMNVNGVLNLIGWVRRNDGHFIPHEQAVEGRISPENPLMITPPLNLLRDVRAEADSGYDRHCTVDNQGVWHNVQRVSANHYFRSESSKRIYASLDAVESGTLAAVYEGAFTLWIVVQTPNIPDRDMCYRLWEMANEWLHRIGSVLDQCEGITVDNRIAKIHAEFLDVRPSKETVVKPSSTGDADKPSSEAFDFLCTISSIDEPHACKVIFNEGFLSYFAFSDNRAERQFVTVLVKAYLDLLKIDANDDKITSLVAKIVTNDDARHFHVFQAQTFMDYVRDTLNVSLVGIDTIDDAAARVGLGWRVADEALGNRVNGKAECNELLAKIVDVLLADLTAELKKFDRAAALRRLVANCEKARDKEDHWRRTSAAMLGLHGDLSPTTTSFVEQMSRFAGAGISSRIIAEIALCVCPLEGGSKLSDIELSKLIARASLLIRIGGLSDAIFYNALKPELTISALGDILFSNDFGELVVEPMLTRAMGDQLKAFAPLQKKNYSPPELAPSAKGTIDTEFWNIWKIEMGFDFDEGRNIIGALEDRGIADKSAIFTLKRSEFFALVSSDKVSSQAALNFLDQFSLVTRERWDKPPKPFSLKDIYPWRLGRRLSLVTRPIIQLDDNEDPELLIAPSLLGKGYGYVVQCTYDGTLDQSFYKTPEMRDSWWGKASEGHTFSSKVAKALSEGGWTVRENIELPEILSRKLEQNFGDIDVLAWRADRNDILVIECKDLSFARTYSEIASLLSNYQGEVVDGMPDKLRRHLNRVKLLQENLSALQRFTGVDSPVVASALACSGIVPMQYAKIEALVGTVVGEIEDILKM